MVGVRGWRGGEGARRAKGGGKGTDPDVEVEVLVRDGFDVEADCRDGGDDFADLWLPQWPSIPVSICDSSVVEGGRRGGIP